VDVRQLGQSALDGKPHLRPAQTAVTGTQRGHGDGSDPALANYQGEVGQPLHNPLHARPLAPMHLGREIDDPAWALKREALGDKNLADMHLTPLAGCRIGAEVLRILLPEHKRDTLAHHADSVHRVDQRFGASVEEVAACERDHQRNQSGCARISIREGDCCAACRNAVAMLSLWQHIANREPAGTIFHTKASAWYRSFFPGSSGSFLKSLRLSNAQSNRTKSAGSSVGGR